MIRHIRPRLRPRPSRLLRHRNRLRRGPLQSRNFLPSRSLAKAPAFRALSFWPMPPYLAFAVTGAYTLISLVTGRAIEWAQAHFFVSAGRVQGSGVGFSGPAAKAVLHALTE